METTLEQVLARGRAEEGRASLRLLAALSTEEVRQRRIASQKRSAALALMAESQEAEERGNLCRTVHENVARQLAEQS